MSDQTDSIESILLERRRAGCYCHAYRRPCPRCSDYLDGVRDGMDAVQAPEPGPVRSGEAGLP